MSRAQLHREARRRLEVSRLRPAQAAALDALVSGRDVLAVMPTGSGKSAIYQLAGALIDGTTVVVSPLIALQQDQVEHIEELDVGDAAVLNSTIGERDRAQLLERFEVGDLEFLFVAPEQLANEATRRAIARADVGLFVVDEAHCTSLWGHDFRPDYLELAGARRALGDPPTLALTATASPPVRDDIVALLALRDPELVASGVDRPNIHLAVERLTDTAEVDEPMLARVGTLAGAGIAYTSTRAATEQLAAALREAGIDAAAYHAGLRSSERDRVQASFMSGELRVVVATWAFGLGIDKPDVRWVAHHAVPPSLDAYYQELGRAGRDGEPAAAILWYRDADLQRSRFQGSTTRVREQDVAAVVDALRGAGARPASELRATTGLSQARLASVLTALEGIGAVARRGRRRAVELVDERTNDTLVAAATEHDERRRRVHATRADMLRTYADTRGCRRQALLAYFAERLEQPCGNCDNCDAGLEAATSSHEGADAPARVGGRVRHATLGDGTLVRHDGDQLVVLFDEAGYRTLGTELVAEQGLLERI